MKKLTVLATIMGLALMLGTPVKAEAGWCFIFCGSGDEVDVEESTVTDSSVSAGDDNTTAIKNANSVVVGDDATARQSNFVGGIGINTGDLSQSNSANLTGQQNNNIIGNDMRSFRNMGSGSNR